MTRNGRLAALMLALGFTFVFHQYSQTQPEVIDISGIELIEELPPVIHDVSEVLVQLDPQEFSCMQKNMYWEARNQKSDEAYIAVGYTVINRTQNKRYPDSICGVVTQARRDSNGNAIRHKCQFSWYCDGKSDIPNLTNVLERQAWERAGELAAAVMREEVDNPVGTATMYHATYVSPYWKTAYRKVATIETHIFYSQKA